MPFLNRPPPASHQAGELPVASAVLADVAEMDRIEQASFATPWNAELIRGAILNPKYIVRVLRMGQHEIAGFYIAHTVERASNLDNLVVDARLRSNGHGRRLINDWIHMAWEQRLFTLTLQVNIDNCGAQRLYRRFHFKQTRRLVGYYPNGDDAYQMEMAFSSHVAEGRLPSLPGAPAAR